MVHVCIAGAPAPHRATPPLHFTSVADLAGALAVHAREPVDIVLVSDALLATPSPSATAAPAQTLPTVPMGIIAVKCTGATIARAALAGIGVVLPCYCAPPDPFGIAVLAAMGQRYHPTVCDFMDGPALDFRQWEGPADAALRHAPNQLGYLDSEMGDMLDELLSNAIKYGGPPSAMIRCTVTTTSQSRILSVIDNAGSLCPHSALKAIAGASAKQVGGRGLALCRLLSHRMIVSVTPGVQTSVILINYLTPRNCGPSPLCILAV